MFRHVLHSGSALSYELASQNIVVKLIEPGGIANTKFEQRSGAEAVQNATIPDYDRMALRKALSYAE